MLDADAALGRAVAVLAAAINGGRRIDAVVVSGDLTDTGDPAAYGRLAAAVATLAGPILIFATGTTTCGPSFTRTCWEASASGPIMQVHDVSGLRVIVLDSSIPAVPGTAD